MKIYVQNIFSENKGINIQIQKIFLEYDHMLGNLSTIQLQISQWSKKKMEINFVASLPNTLVERKKQMNKQSKTGTESQWVVTGGQGARGMREIGEGD